MSKPFPIPTWPYVRSGPTLNAARHSPTWLPCAESTPTGLQRTVEDFNRHARVGQDPEFERGTTAFNRASGDPEHQPNPSLAPLEKGPYYAIKVRPGSFGTFFGLRADARSRALNAAGEPIPGLYVACSDQANVMGRSSPSGGINIGPAMTFGYIAGRDAARRAGIRERGSGPADGWGVTAEQRHGSQHQEEPGRSRVHAGLIAGGGSYGARCSTVRGCNRQPNQSSTDSATLAALTAASADWYPGVCGFTPARPRSSS